jgi:hypothetical protein
MNRLTLHVYFSAVFAPSAALYLVNPVILSKRQIVREIRVNSWLKTHSFLKKQTQFMWFLGQKWLFWKKTNPNKPNSNPIYLGEAPIFYRGEDGFLAYTVPND